MEEKQYQRVIGASISFACHIVAFFQFRLNIYSLEAGIRWSVPFYILLGVSLLLSIVLFFLRNKYADLVLLLIRIPLLIQIGYPLGDYIGIESILLIALIVEMILYLTFPTNIVFSITYSYNFSVLLFT